MYQWTNEQPLLPIYFILNCKNFLILSILSNKEWVKTKLSKSSAIKTKNATWNLKVFRANGENKEK